MGTHSYESRKGSTQNNSSDRLPKRPAKSNVPASVSQVLNEEGSPLDADLRAAYQSGFGHDFSKVRIHSGPLAARSAAEVDARAYTVGDHIVFGNGQLAPSTAAGRHLLAHELAHTVQQTPSAPAELAVTDSLDAREQSANQAAGQVLAGQRGVANGLHSGPPALMRQATTSEAPGANVASSFEVQATAYAFQADAQWNIQGSAHSKAEFSARVVDQKPAYIPPVPLSIDFNQRWIIQIVVSVNNGATAQSYFWRCNATAQPITIDPLGPVPLSGGGSGDPSLALGGSQQVGTSTFVQVNAAISTPTTSITHTPPVWQPQGGISGTGTSGAGTSGQGTGGGSLTFNLTRVPAYDQRQQSPATPVFPMAFTADIVLANAPPAPVAPKTPDVPDLTYVVNFANDSSTITSKELTGLLEWAHKTLGQYEGLRDAIRTGEIRVHITGKASTRGNDRIHNFTLSQHRVDNVRVALEGAASSTGGGRTSGGVLGGESLKIDPDADGDFHDPMPADKDQDRVVQIFIKSTDATEALKRLANPPAKP